MNDSAEKTLYRVVELAEKFSVKDTTIRKYITDFEIPHQKDGRKTLLNNDSVSLLTEILKLKESGMSIKKIKEIRQAQIQAESKNNTTTISASEKTDKPAKSKTKTETPEPKPEEIKPQSQEPKAEKTEFEITEAKIEDKPEGQKSQEKKHNNKRKNKKEKYNKDSENNTSKESVQRNNTVLTRDFIGQEITNQSRRVSKINRQLGSNPAPRERAEMETSLNLRFNFLAGLRYIRDNWLSDKK